MTYIIPCIVFVGIMALTPWQWRVLAILPAFIVSAIAYKVINRGNDEPLR